MRYSINLIMIFNNIMWSYVGLCGVALAIVGFTHYVYRWRNPKCNGGRLPPGSMGFPLIGETIQFFLNGNASSLDVPHFFKKRFARYGNLFRTSLMGRQMVVSSDPEFNYFIFQQERKLVQFSFMESLNAVFGGTLPATTDAYIHKYSRILILNHFGTESLKEKLLLPQLEAMAIQALQSWSTQPSVELKTSITTMIFNWISKYILDFDSTKSSEDLSWIFTNFYEAIITYPINIPGTAFHRCMKNQKRMANFLRNILRERLNSTEKQRRGDFLDQMIDDMKTEEFVTEDLVVYYTFGVLLNCFSSISAPLTLALKLLMDHPLVVKELKEEQEEILKNRENADSPLTWKEYKSMTFMSQVINETLRFLIAPGLFRKATTDIHVNGYVIPEGWTIMIFSSAVHMNPDKFKDPFAFDPWRWNDIGSNTSFKNFMPFGGGARNCVGAEFGKTLISVFLHVFLTKFSWTKIKGGSLGDGFYLKVSERDEIKTMAV